MISDRCLTFRKATIAFLRWTILRSVCSRRQGQLIAYKNACPHFGGPVCQGKVINRVEENLLPDKRSKGLRFSRDEHVVCPWHGYEFNLMTGKHPGDPKIQLTRIPVSIRDERVRLQIPA